MKDRRFIRFSKIKVEHKLISAFLGVLGVIFILSCFVVNNSVHSLIQEEEKENTFKRKDYISSCYILTPKQRETAFFYEGLNTISKVRKVNKIVIPSKVTVGTTSSNYKSNFVHGSASFNSNVDLKDNLTINPRHEYPMDTKHNYIQIIWVKNLYQYKSPSSDSFVAPTNKKHGQDNNNKVFRSNGVYYIRLSEYQMKFKPHYNISKTKASICLGYVNK